MNIQHQMEVFTTIYMVSNMTPLTKMIILNIHFPLFCQMKLKSVKQCFHFENDTLVNKVQDMTQKIIYWRILIMFVGNPQVYQAP